MPYTKGREIKTKQNKKQRPKLEFGSANTPLRLWAVLPSTAEPSTLPKLGKLVSRCAPRELPGVCPVPWSEALPAAGALE